MKYLVTGGSGFVGQHLIDLLIAQNHHVTSIDALPPKHDASNVAFHQISLIDQKALERLIAHVQPDRIIHLASASSVAFSWEKPVECFINNTNIFLNLVEAIRQLKIKCRILSVGSSEEYGLVSQADVPISETHQLNPKSPYAVARVAQEHLSKVYANGYGLDIVCTRSFNHLGPGQSDRFVISSFVRQAVAVKRGQLKQINCGNIDIVRDLMDVRDVVRAYLCILDHGKTGDVYNVCSGKGISLRDVLEKICIATQIGRDFVQDPNLMRPIDSPVILGNNATLINLGFKNTYDLDHSLKDLVEYWESVHDA